MQIASVLGISATMLAAACGGSNHGNGSGGGGSDAGSASGGGGCVGSACVVDCVAMGKPETVVSGTVFAPNGTLPLFGINVYVPTRDPGPVPDGLTCARCSDSLPGEPLLSTVSDENGAFALNGAPAGDNVPLVITTGKWRRQIVIPHVEACATTTLAAADTSLPRDRSQGDMPRIAIATGAADSLECLARKLGVADSEITTDRGTGHLHLYAGNGGKDQFKTGFPGGSGEKFSVAGDLWNSVDRLESYDIVMLSCEGAPYADEKPQSAMAAVKSYVDAGGRLFLSHWHDIWISGEKNKPAHGLPEWEPLATWTFNEAELPANSSSLIDERGNPKGGAFASWMLHVGGSTVRDRIDLQNQAPENGTVLSTGRTTCSGVDGNKVERWVYLPADLGTPPPPPGGGTQNFQFTTPIEKDADQRCGKVVFSDMHVSGTSGQGLYPDSCGSTQLTPQEKALAFMFFDIASCVGVLL